MRYENAVAMRNKILGEATRLMLSRQYAELTMVDVATAVPVAKPTLYRYFATKDELRRAVLAYLQDTNADTSDAAVKTYTASLLQAVTTMTLA